MRSFITSQFGKCPLIWMYHRILNNKTTLEELLSKEKTDSIHYGNLQVLPIEMFKIKNKMYLEILTEIF